MSTASFKKTDKNPESGFEIREKTPNSKISILNSAGKASFGSPWRVILTTIAIFLLSQAAAAFIVGFVTALNHHGRSTIDIFNNSTLDQFFYVLIAEGLAIGLVLWLVKRKKIKFSAIGLGRRPAWQDLKWAFTGGLIFYGLIVVGSILLSLFVSQNELNKQQDLGFNNLVTTLDRTLAFVSLVIIPPLGEETLVRGYLYSGLRKSMRFWPALLVTSVLFGLAHLDGGAAGSTIWPAAFDTFILSAVLVYVRDRSNALYAGMLIHGLNNLVAYGVHFK